ncbi:MAG TPA: ATP-binding protein [Methylomirabilota bacterium]|nr:ATP-binding protein [Methylomirabilota bacterium]
MNQVGASGEWAGEPGRDKLAVFTRSLEAEVRELRAKLAAQQRTLVTAHRMMTLGRLLSDVAHDVSNPLTTLVARSAMIRMTSSTLEDAQRHAAIIEEQGQRAARSMRTVSGFGLGGEPGRAPLDLNEVVHAVIELQRHQLAGSNITVTAELERGLPHISGEEQQLQHVVLNLVLNAYEAIEATREGGAVTVSTHADEGTVWVSVRDNGPGMPPEVADRAFQSFFTTKDERLGLGLGIARELALAHGGDIAVQSVQGAGTIVTLTLPRPVAPPPAAHAGLAEHAAVASRRPLLVVDDESEVGELLSDILRTRGYETQYVASPRAALELIRDRDFQGVLMDLRMPEMSGTELWRELQRERPALALKTIFMTGDYASLDTVAMLSGTERPLLSKPFRSDELDLALASLDSMAKGD